MEDLRKRKMGPKGTKQNQNSSTKSLTALLWALPKAPLLLIAASFSFSLIYVVWTSGNSKLHCPYPYYTVISKALRHSLPHSPSNRRSGRPRTPSPAAEPTVSSWAPAPNSPPQPQQALSRERPFCCAGALGAIPAQNPVWGSQCLPLFPWQRST